MMNKVKKSIVLVLMIILGIVIGFFIGGFLGVSFMAILNMSRDDDK